MNIWDKLTNAVLVLLVCAGIVAVCVWYLPIIQKNERTRKHLLELETEVQKEDDIGKKLRASIDATYNDPKTVERLARNHLGYAKTGEVVIRFEAPAAPQARR